MKLKFLLPAVLSLGALLSACSSKENGTHSSYYGICSFEYTDLETVWTDSLYMTDGFVGADGVSFSGYNPASTMNPTETGFVISARHDSRLEAGYQARDLAVLDKGAFHGTTYVIYVDKNGAAPRHTVSFDYNSLGTCMLNGLYVHNTNRVATLAAYGLGDVPAFAKGDWLKLTITGYLGTTKTSTVEVMLADYTGAELNLLKEWTAVKTEEFGKFQYLDFSVTSNRTDVPLQACIDYLVTNIEIDY